MQGENIYEASLHTSASGLGWKAGAARNSTAGYKGGGTKVSRLLKKGGRGAQQAYMASYITGTSEKRGKEP